MPFCVSPSRLLNALWQRKSHLILKYIYICVDKTVSPHPRIYLCHCQFLLFINFLRNRERTEGV